MMDTDKAYLLGLIIGGGKFGNGGNTFSIKLPYKKWGSYKENPQRAGEISKDILKQVGAMFRAIYKVTVQYETTESGAWTILIEGDITDLKIDLSNYGVQCYGEIRGNADIELIINDLVDDNLKRRFIAGLADTIGSMADSHRRFSEEHQIISFEIKGYNFKFVCDLCRLLYSIKCIPDQINWNHPNIHCTRDPYYKQWQKGFKLRVLLDQYSRFGAFMFRTKKESANNNLKRQKESHKAGSCETRDMHFTPSTVHPAENAENLPDIIRGGHYIHFRHFCTVLGCEHAPYCKIKEQFKNIGKLINPFPILHKDSLQEINNLIQNNPLLANRNYTLCKIHIKNLFDMYKLNKSKLLYGNSDDSGYPIEIILQAVAYVIANDNELFGKRTSSYMELIEKHLEENGSSQISLQKPDLLTPLIISANNRGALVGAFNPSVYEKLVTIAQDNNFKLLVRQITEQDLKNEKRKN